MIFVDKGTFAGLPIPDSLGGRAVLLLVFTGFLETAVAVLGRYFSLAEALLRNFIGSGGGQIFESAFFSGSVLFDIVGLFSNFLSVLAAAASLWLVAYAVLRLTRRAEPGAENFFWISVFSLGVFYFWAIASTLLELCRNPEIRQIFNFWAFAEAALENVLCFVLTLWFARFLFAKIRATSAGEAFCGGGVPQSETESSTESSTSKVPEVFDAALPRPKTQENYVGALAKFVFDLARRPSVAKFILLAALVAAILEICAMCLLN